MRYRTQSEALISGSQTGWKVTRRARFCLRITPRALELGPGEPSSHYRYAGFLLGQGRFDEALPHMERAYELDPTSVSIIYLLEAGYGYARRYEDAIVQFDKTLEMEPNSSRAYAGLGWINVSKGYQDGIEQLEKAAKLEEITGANVLAELGRAYAFAGRRSDAVRVLGELEALQKKGRGSWGAQAVVHASHNEADEAFDALEKSLEEREWWVFFLKVHPDFDNLRSDPRFPELVRRTGLTP